jgi:hypothetical protein
MKIPYFVFIATILFLIAHITETILTCLLVDGSWRIITLILNLITVLIPILFLLKVKAAHEALKIIAIITVVYGFLFNYLNYTEKSAFGEFSTFMWLFNSFQILTGLFLYYSLFRVKTSIKIKENR